MTNARLLEEFEPHTYEQWKAAAEALLKGAPFDKVLFTKTYEGFDLKPLYRREDVQGLSHLQGLPGSANPVRAARAGGYLSKPWLISQELPYSTPKAFNQAAVPDVERGQTELNILLDMAGLAGMDPDATRSGAVGACGLSLASLQDLEVALSGIDLRSISVYFQSGVASLPVAGLFAAFARKRGIEGKDLRGCFGCDPLGQVVWNGSLPVSFDRAFRDMAVLTSYVKNQLPAMQSIEVNTNPYHNGGGNAVDEVAFALSTGVAYLNALRERGVEPADALPRLRFSMAVGGQFFLEIAKFRAMRMLWARVVSAYGIEKTIPFHLHVRTGLWNKTQYDPYVNMLRTTTEAFSAVLGGCDSLHVGPFDEIIRVPDTFSRRIARNTHLILREECDLTRTIDPAGGSYAVEALTDEIARAAWSSFQEIEGAGGMVAALQSGLPQRKVAAVRAAREANIAKRRDLIVGTNVYPNATEQPLANVPQNYNELQRVRGEEIAAFRTSDASASHNAVLGALEAILKADSSQLAAAVVAAAQVGATLGEISRTLWSGDGEVARIEAIPIRRASQSFETLRRRAEQAGRPKILQANLGPSRGYRARADWTSAFFQVGGFDVLNTTDFDETAAIIEATASTGARVVVLTSSDDQYAERVVDVAKALKALPEPPRVLLAGAAGEQESTWRAAGVDDFVNVRVNCYDMLCSLMDLLAPEGTKK